MIHTELPFKIGKLEVKMTTHDTASRDHNYYVLVANDVVFDQDKAVTAVDIADTLLSKGMWAFTASAPLRAKLRVGDRLLVYLAGQGRRHFVASAVVGAESTEATDSDNEVLEPLGLDFMPYSLGVSDVRRFPSPVQIRPLLADLAFVKDKKNYGLHLRLPVVRVTASDFRLVVSASNQHKSL